MILRDYVPDDATSIEALVVATDIEGDLDYLWEVQEYLRTGDVLRGRVTSARVVLAFQDEHLGGELLGLVRYELQQDDFPCSWFLNVIAVSATRPPQPRDSVGRTLYTSVIAEIMSGCSKGSIESLVDPANERALKLNRAMNAEVAPDPSQSDFLRASLYWG